MPAQSEVKDYLARSGDTSFKWHWPRVEFRDGWFSWFINGSEFCIGQAYGDHREIASRARDLAKSMNCTKIIFATKRSGKAFERLTGAKIIATVLELPLEG